MFDSAIFKRTATLYGVDRKENVKRDHHHTGNYSKIMDLLGIMLDDQGMEFGNSPADPGYRMVTVSLVIETEKGDSLSLHTTDVVQKNMQIAEDDIALSERDMRVLLAAAEKGYDFQFEPISSGALAELHKDYQNDLGDDELFPFSLICSVFIEPRKNTSSGY